MTDIHGYYDAMLKMFEKISFSAYDRMICAGDYIDRGPKSFEMLQWIEWHGENILLLRGNHDEEFVYYVGCMRSFFRMEKLKNNSVRETLSVYREIKRTVKYFDEYGTMEYLIREKKAALWKLSAWAGCICKMPYFHETMIHGRRCIIVHAGYIESLESLKGVRVDDEYESLEDFYLTARNDAYFYGGVEHGMIVSGHTPTTAIYEFPYNHGDVFRMYDEKTDCIFYDIDCGYAWKTWNPEAKLACLRLEDEKIFYIY